MRLGLLLALSLFACRSEPVATDAVPVTSAAAAPKRVCEPTVTCGMWSKCAWLELDHVEPKYEVFRIAGGDAGGYGSHYWRWHYCWPEDAGKSGCALYCDKKGACVDALESDSVCTGSAAPHPSPYVCEVRGSDCVTLP